MIEIRSYRERDRQAVTAIILPIQQQEFGIAINAADQPDLQDIRGFYQSGNGGFWVACHQGEVVGTVGLKDISGGQAALRKMFVKSGYRGAPLLVAAGLLDQARAHARTHRISDIYLGTTNQFISTQHFYRKQGFSAVTRDDLPAAFPLMAVDSLFFHLSLSPQ